jgi:Icc protein
VKGGTQPKMLKIVQLSDCHVSAERDAVYRGINPRDTLELLLTEVRAWQPELLLLTGDLAEDGSEAAYEYLAEKLKPFEVPVLTVPGNHDHQGRQKRHFQHTACEEPMLYEAGGWQLILLNSVIPGQVHGALSTVMLAGLDKLLAESSGPRLVVLHHQPVAVGSNWIDRYALTRPEKLWSCLQENPHVKAVLWGHIHHEYSDTKNHVKLLGAPSTSANSLPGRDKFIFNPAGPAGRWINLWKEGRLETGILGLGA